MGKPQGSLGRREFTSERGCGVKDIARLLRRLHQNLEHPASEDLARHLRLSGANNEVLRAGAKSARPATEPKALEFGDVVGADMLYAYDVEGRKQKFFSMIGHASTYPGDQGSRTDWRHP